MLCLSDSIRDDDPSVQRLLCTVEEAHTLPALILAAWSLARVLAIHLVEAVLAERARRPTSWPCCPQCGAGLRSKGFVKRQVISLVGPLRWQRRVGRCPQGCETPQVAPFDEELGLQPHQRTSGELQSLGCALAVFVPFATAATLLSWHSAASISPRALWGWVQAAGQRTMEQLQAQLQAVAQGQLPTEEPLAPELVAAPLLLGADGVMVPFRPEGGQPRGKTAWHEIKVGVLARLGRHRTRSGKVVARAVQQLWKGAAAWLDGRTSSARRWFIWARHRLRHGNPDGVLADLDDALELEGLPATARDTLTTVYAYLQRHRDHINYAAYKALGLPLGSGMVESACKWLIQQRFKGVGMRWSEDGFNHLLHLRLAWVNGSFEALFQVQLQPSPNT